MSARDKVILAVYVDVKDIPPEYVAEHMEQISLIINAEEDDSLVHYIIPVRTGDGSRVECVYPHLIIADVTTLQKLQDQMDQVVKSARQKIEGLV